MREVLKYLDVSVHSLDLVCQLRLADLRPETQQIKFDWAFPKTLNDFDYLSRLPDK